MNILLYIVFSKRRGRFRRCRDFIRESLRLRLRVLVARERFNRCSTAAAGAESEPDTLGSGRPRSVERAAPQPRYFTVTFQQPQQYLLTSCLLTHNFLPTLPCFYTRQLGAHFVADRKPPRELAAAEGRYGSARGYDAKAEEHDAYVQRSSGCVLSSCFFHVEKMTEYFTNLM